MGEESTLTNNKQKLDLSLHQFVSLCDEVYWKLSFIKIFRDWLHIFVRFCGMISVIPPFFLLWFRAIKELATHSCSFPSPLFAIFPFLSNYSELWTRYRRISLVTQIQCKKFYEFGSKNLIFLWHCLYFCFYIVFLKHFHYKIFRKC